MTENAQRILQQAFGDAVYACPLPDLSQAITDFIANSLSLSRVICFCGQVVSRHHGFVGVLSRFAWRPNPNTFRALCG